MTLRERIVSPLTVQEAADNLFDLRERIKTLREAEYELYRVVIDGLNDLKATKLRTDKVTVTMTEPVTYDATILTRLREITDPSDLEGVYTPEHEEVTQVPERWNMSKGRKLLALGKEHKAIIEDAKIYGQPKLAVERGV